LLKSQRGTDPKLAALGALPLAADFFTGLNALALSADFFFAAFFLVAIRFP
jgi:hypothetical protein